MQEEEHTNVYVKYLPNYIEDKSLYSLFSPYGKIVSAKVMVDHITGKSRGYGFVKFHKKEEANKAIKTLDGHKIGGKTLLCKISHSFVLRNPSSNLYIKPLPLSLSEEELKEIFEKYGAIATLRLVSDLGYSDTQIGFVRYEKVQCAITAIQELDGTRMFSHLPPLIVKYAESEAQKIKRKTQNKQANQEQQKEEEREEEEEEEEEEQIIQLPPTTITNYRTQNITNEYTTNDYRNNYTITTTTTTTTMVTLDNNQNNNNINNNNVNNNINNNNINININNNNNNMYPYVYYPNGPTMPTVYIPVVVYGHPGSSPYFHYFQNYNS